MRRLRSIRGQIVIVVALGLVTTVAIAWMSAIYATSVHTQVVRGQIATGSSVTIFWVRTTAFITQVFWQDSARPEYKDTVNLDVLPNWSRVRALEPSDLLWTPPGAHLRWEIAYGWPMRSMLARFNSHHVNLPTGGKQTDYLTDSGIHLEPIRGLVNPYGGRDGQPRALPLRILPLGFTVNTALAVSLWWLLLFAYPTTRRYIRMRRGTCLSCGYGPLAAPNAVCPECGRVRGERPASRE